MDVKIIDIKDMILNWDEDIWYLIFELSENVTVEWNEYLKEQGKELTYPVIACKNKLTTVLPSNNMCLHFNRLKYAIEQTNEEYKEEMKRKERIRKMQKDRIKFEEEKKHEIRKELGFA
jgi:hypothetical protein